jgi:hypothetical protein
VDKIDAVIRVRDLYLSDLDFSASMPGAAGEQTQCRRVNESCRGVVSDEAILSSVVISAQHTVVLKLGQRALLVAGEHAGVRVDHGVDLILSQADRGVGGNLDALDI